MSIIANLTDLNDHNRRTSKLRAAALEKLLDNLFVARYAASEIEAAHRGLLMFQDPAERFEAFRTIHSYEHFVKRAEDQLASLFAEQRRANQRAISKKSRKPPVFKGGRMA